MARPTDEEFVGYAKNNEEEKLTEALRRYPDLVHARDKVMLEIA